MRQETTIGLMWHGNGWTFPKKCGPLGGDSDLQKEKTISRSLRGHRVWRLRRVCTTDPSESPELHRQQMRRIYSGSPELSRDRQPFPANHFPVAQLAICRHRLQSIAPLTVARLCPWANKVASARRLASGTLAESALATSRRSVSPPPRSDNSISSPAFAGAECGCLRNGGTETEGSLAATHRRARLSSCRRSAEDC